MTADMARMLSGIAAFAAFLSLLYLFIVQIRIWPDDRQKWAATAFILATLLVVGQLCWAYLGGPSLAMSPRGVVSFLAWAITTVGLAWETQRYLQSLDDS